MDDCYMDFLPVDLEQFWRDDELAHRENCFYAQSPQVALGIRMSDECVFSELNEYGEQWGYTPVTRRIELNKRYNDKSERIVGKRLLEESFLPENASFPCIKRIGEVFGGQYVWYNGTEWLKGNISTPGELEDRLNVIEKMNLREFMLPDNWEAECRRIYQTYGIRPPCCYGVRGPITLACSIAGIENLIFLLMDERELAERFSKVIGDVIIAMKEIIDAENGSNDVRGFGFADDNCCMLNPDMYEQFGYPILKRVFERFCPGETDMRYQHSDSAMGHLLPTLGRLDLTGVNFGPTVLVDEIRTYLPHARIDGCIAPFTFMGKDKQKLINEVKRDCAMAKQYGKGVNIDTAGSINDGSSLENMRTVMWAIQSYGRY